MGEWKKVKLGDCIKEINDRTIENNQYEVLTSSKNGIFSQLEYFDKQVASKDNTGYKIIKKGQFTYRSMSDSGRFTINRLENKEIGIVSPAYPVFETTKIDPVYLKYYFESELFRKAIHNLSQGSTRTALKYKDLSEIEIILPPIEEQEKIIKILENVDKIINKYENLLEQKEEFIRTQFVKMFGNISEKEKLKDVCYIKARIGWQRLNREEYLNSGDYYLITGVDINNRAHKINYNKCCYVSKERYDKDSKIQLKNGDIILTKDGTIGKVAIIEDLDKPATLNSHLFVIRDLTGNLSNTYFLNLFLSKLFTDFVYKNETGGTRKGLNQSVIENFMIPLPNLKQQKDFERIYNMINKQKIELEELIESYKKLKKGLMQQLLTGKVRVKI